ncbi:hypothetical protein pb186bvf_013284 [Paramecium bursaria]
MDNDQQFEKDNAKEWWQAGQEDNYDVLQKIKRVGCRVTQRKYLQCIQDNYDEKHKCHSIRDDLDECMKLYEFIQLKQLREQQGK